MFKHLEGTKISVLWNKYKLHFNLWIVNPPKKQQKKKQNKQQQKQQQKKHTQRPHTSKSTKK